MKSAGVLILVIAFLAVGCLLGWHAQRAKSAHGDVKVAKNRLSGGRQLRVRAGLWVVGMAILAVLVLSAFVRR
jgi:hypothetical protein